MGGWKGRRRRDVGEGRKRDLIRPRITPQTASNRQFHLNFGFGAIDAEAMVTRAKHWVTVPAQVASSVSVATTRYDYPNPFK